MPENRIEDRLAELREKIHYHNHRYFVLDDPLIEDSKFDELMVELSDDVDGSNKLAQNYFTCV